MKNTSSLARSALVAGLILVVSSLSAALPVASLPRRNDDRLFEVTTNMPLLIDYGRLKNLHISLELTASTTNGVEVLLGRDANGDARLSVDEADVAFGYDCGTWFVRDTVRDVQILESDMRLGCVSRMYVLSECEVLPEWDLMRVTRRGFGDISESVTIGIENKKFQVVIR